MRCTVHTSVIVPEDEDPDPLAVAWVACGPWCDHFGAETTHVSASSTGSWLDAAT